LNLYAALLRGAADQRPRTGAATANQARDAA